MSRTPASWKRDDTWKYGGRPGDPLHVTNEAPPRSLLVALLERLRRILR